jgi:hypothetical protein
MIVRDIEEGATGIEGHEPIRIRHAFGPKPLKSRSAGRLQLRKTLVFLFADLNRPS